MNGYKYFISEDRVASGVSWVDLRVLSMNQCKSSFWACHDHKSSSSDIHKKLSYEDFIGFYLQGLPLILPLKNAFVKVCEVWKESLTPSQLLLLATCYLGV